MIGFWFLELRWKMQKGAIGYNSGFRAGYFKDIRFIHLLSGHSRIKAGIHLVLIMTGDYLIFDHPPVFLF